MKFGMLCATVMNAILFDR